MAQMRVGLLHCLLLCDDRECHGADLLVITWVGTCAS